MKKTESESPSDRDSPDARGRAQSIRRPPWTTRGTRVRLYSERPARRNTIEDQLDARIGRDVNRLRGAPAR
jgi:hypothetical protein